MQKDILIVVSDNFGGFGDFLFALKLVNQLKNYHSDITGESPSIHIVSQPSGKQKIKALQGGAN